MRWEIVETFRTLFLIFILIFAGAATTGIGGCGKDNDTTAEEVQEEAGEAAEETKEAAEKMMEEAGDAVEKAGDKVEEATDK